MPIHAIHIHPPERPILSGHLKMGGENPQGIEINANNCYLTLAGEPWYPVMGEFHYARYPRAAWREELLKMKAGGITVVASYLFWNYHEERQGRFNWQGDRDLRYFIQLSAECGLYAYPRIGPWVHGEARNGGFPDWLLFACGTEVRGNHPKYLRFVQSLFEQIAVQLKGLLWKDGGPVVGIQLENELADNPEHIARLKKMALEVGLDVPLYTMTGWGPAQVPQDEVIPVFGGYPDAFWDRHHDDWSRPCRKHYFFTSIRDDNAIGADLQRSAQAPDLDYLERYPYGTCELGGGMPPSYHRRPIIAPQDIEAIAFCKLGSGANWLGYYMYHGGTHAAGPRGGMQETQESGYPNDLAARSYDFQAPLGEFGQVRPHYQRLRRLHLFLQDFGTKLAPMPVYFPEVLPAGVDDRTTPRWSVRSDGKSGFLFANTYQRIENLPGLSQIQFQLKLSDEILTIPAQPTHIPPGRQLLWPFHLDLNGIKLRYATANPLCHLHSGNQEVFVFSANEGISPEFAFEEADCLSIRGAAHQAAIFNHIRLLSGLKPGPDCLLELQSRGDKLVTILVLDAPNALNLAKVKLWGQEHLLLTPASAWVDGTLRLASRDPLQMWFGLYPEPLHKPTQSGLPLESSQAGIFTKYLPSVPAKEIHLETRRIQPAGRAKPVGIGPGRVAQAPSDAAYQNAEVWTVRLPDRALDDLHELFLQIEYAGDTARAYLSGEMIADMEQELIADDFWHGAVWEIGIKRYSPRALNEGLELRFIPLRQDAPIYIPKEVRPLFKSDQELQVLSIRAVPEYAIEIE
jgi:beta-galactosidase